MILIGQQPRAHQIDGQPDAGDRDRLVVFDRDRIEETGYRFIPDEERDQQQDERACEGGQFAELAGAEREPRVGGVAARKAIGQRGDRERGDVGRHVDAVGHHGHRAEQGSAGDFRDHGGRRERDHEPGAPLVTVMLLAEEDMGVMPAIERVRVHGRPPFGLV